MEFVVDTKGYVFYTDEKSEANYLVSLLNSNSANLTIKDFQTTGLFSPRDVHKKILEVPLPKYDSGNPANVAIAGLGERCTELVQQ